MIKHLTIIALLITSFATAQNTETLFLSDKDNNSTVKWDFFCTKGRNSGNWTKIVVPSCWEQQGFGNCDYGRSLYTYGKKNQFADEEGIYKHQFVAPKSWKGKTIQLVFEGAMTDAEVKINGQLAGSIHQGAFYQFRYDINDKIKIGASNELEVKVSIVSANKSMNSAEGYSAHWYKNGNKPYNQNNRLWV
jgi:beta-galactosidase/beta-glucuronidase